MCNSIYKSCSFNSTYIYIYIHVLPQLIRSEYDFKCDRLHHGGALVWYYLATNNTSAWWILMALHQGSADQSIEHSQPAENTRGLPYLSNWNRPCKWIKVVLSKMSHFFQNNAVPYHNHVETSYTVVHLQASKQYISQSGVHDVRCIWPGKYWQFMAGQWTCYRQRFFLKKKNYWLAKASASRGNSFGILFYRRARCFSSSFSK